MGYFTIYNIIFIVLSVKGKYWYPVNTRVSSERITFLNDPVQVKRYTQIPSSKLKQSSESIKRNLFNSTIIDKTVYNRKVSGNQIIELNNNIINTNFINITRNKNKVHRRLCAPKTKRYNPNSSSKGRFLEVFEVVQFEHVSCTSSTGLEGTCLPEIDCSHQGGTVMGSCADGYGTCCIAKECRLDQKALETSILSPCHGGIHKTINNGYKVNPDPPEYIFPVLFNCDGRSNALAGWFTNPGFPSPSTERLSCIFTMDKNSVNIKQIRLDFMNFELLPPIYGNCEQDQFVVTAQDTNNIIPILCGINTGQHVYIEVSNVVGPLMFSMQTVAEDNRIYSIKITQLTAWDTLAAPTGCLQFFKETQGHLESFNYRDRSEIGIPRSASYMNNFNYAMCIERSPNSCSVTYTNVGEMQIVNYDTEGLPVIPPQQAGVEILNCPSDYLLMAAVRLCGERLNDGSVLQDFSLDAPVTDDSAGPIVIWFRSDGVYTGRGFKLNYQQNPCTK